MNDLNCYVNEPWTEKCSWYSRDIETDVFESYIISQSGIPRSEIQIYLNELESRRFTEEVRPRPSDADFRLWRILNQGVE